MIQFPYAKINIGLRVIEKRNDGFHNIETIFYPLYGLYDCLELFESKELRFENTGIAIDAPLEQNLCIKAWQLLHAHYGIPPVAIHLHKRIPFGAGLGGGSSNAAYMLRMLNEYFSLSLTTEQLQTHALALGSDCPFFIQSQPVFAEGRGEKFSSCSLSLAGMYMVLLHPAIHVSTAQAYSRVEPQKHCSSLSDAIPTDIALWKSEVKNDFETSVFQQFPYIEELKHSLYSMGAVYASMSGSGSAVFGLFESKPLPEKSLPVVWQGVLE